MIVPCAMKFFPLVLALFCATNLAAQAGCPDPQANNFNPAATSNDGSCLYPATNYAPVFKATLPGTLLEISGMTQAGGKWWGHNDSGADEVFYSINPETGTILQTIELKNAKNRDWEEITADNTQLYIGDFGNNSNNRQNLGIYIVPLSQIGNGSTETVQEFGWSFLPFSYNDQTNYAAQPEDSSVYDCEAMIIHGGKIHLFTKSRRYHNTAHYIVNPSNNGAEKTETFDSQGVITGASISPDGLLIALLGYDLRPLLPKVFCWLLWDWPAGTDQFFAGNKRRIELGNALQVGQAESIGFAGNRSGYLTNEVTKFNGVTFVEQAVRGFDFSPWVPESVSTAQPMERPGSLRLIPNPFSQTVQIQHVEPEQPDSLRIQNQSGQTVMSLQSVPKTLDLGSLPPGVYSFETWRNGQRVGWAKGVKQ